MLLWNYTRWVYDRDTFLILLTLGTFLVWMGFISNGFTYRFDLTFRVSRIWVPKKTADHRLPQYLHPVSTGGVNFFSDIHLAERLVGTSAVTRAETTGDHRSV